MRPHLLAVVLLCATAARGQMEMPPGTTSAVPRQASPVPSDAAVLQKAEDAIANGRYDGAVALLQPLATPQQKNERIFYDLGFAQDALNRNTEAALTYRKALELAPGDVSARISLGLLLARDGDRKGAAEHLTAATKSPDVDKSLLARAFRALAEIHLAEGDPAGARADLVSALRQSPETADDAVTAAEIATAMHDDAADVQAWAHAFMLAPSSTDAAAGYARALARGKKFAEAGAVLTSALQQHPGNRALLTEAASEKLLAGDVTGALPPLVQLHQSDADDSAVSLLLARAYGAANQPEKAEPIFASLLQAAPDDPTLLTETADNLIRLHRSEEAKPLLQRALTHPERFPSQAAVAEAAGELAFAASAAKDPETVLRALDTRAKIISPTAVFTFLAAGAHDTLHHTKQAAEAYRLFLQQSAGQFPDQEWQAKQRLQILDRAK